jgi:hypothetical protein
MRASQIAHSPFLSRGDRAAPDTVLSPNALLPPRFWLAVHHIAGGNGADRDRRTMPLELRLACRLAAVVGGGASC